jgi:two-component system NtrC family response regulator
MAEKGEFRKDLLFRLKALTIQLPPLREHKEDIKDLTRFHVARLCDRYGMETKGFSPDFFDALEIYDWPGNTRELVNTVEAALSAAEKAPTLFSKHLPVHLRVSRARALAAKHSQLHTRPGDQRISPSYGQPMTLRDFRQSAEKQYLQRIITQVNCDMRKACELSGLSRSRLYDLLTKYGLSFSGK